MSISNAEREVHELYNLLYSCHEVFLQLPRIMLNDGMMFKDFDDVLVVKLRSVLNARKRD